MNKIFAIFAVLLGLAAAGCNFSNNFCCLSGLTCPSIGRLAIGNDSFGLEDLNVLSFGDITITHGDVQGRVFTRNNFYGSNGISVGDLLTDSHTYALVVGGNIQIDGSAAVNPAYQSIFTGSSGSSVPAEINPRITVGCSSAGCLNSAFDSLKNYWSAFSSTLSLQASNVDLTITEAGVALISCQSSSAYAYYVSMTPSQFNSVSSYNLSSSCTATTSIVVNIIGQGDVVFNGDSLNITADYTIFNVGPSATVTINTSVNGNIVAPNSNVYMIKGTIFGQLIANNISNLVQVNTIVSGSGRNCQQFPDSGSCVNVGSFTTGPQAPVPSASSTTTGSGSVTVPSTTAGNDGANSGGNEAANTGSGTSQCICSSALTMTVSIFAALLAVILL